MPVEMKMWRIDGSQPQSLKPSALPAEKDLQRFLEVDASLLGEPLLVIGSEVLTPYGKRLDLLAIDGDGNLHLLELKRDRTPREVVAQILDYGSWATTLSHDEIVEIANAHLDDHPFEAAFEEVFGVTPPDELNTSLQLTIVAAELDSSSERIVSYLRDFGVPINAVFFTYLEDDGRRYLARSWLTSSDDDTPTSAQAKNKSKRASWNGRDWYVSFGSDRPWEDARTYGFVSAGGGKFYSQTMRSLPVGARVWVNVPAKGYVGVGRTLAPAIRYDEAKVRVDGQWVRLADQPLHGTYRHEGDDADENAEWVVPVEWIATRPESEGFWQKGMFASQHSACKLRQEFTLHQLAKHFGVDADS